MTTFTPVASLLGGMLIGCSAVLLMWSAGRIAGITGLVSGVLTGVKDGGFAIRAAFLGGLLAAPLLYIAVTGRAPEQTVSGNLPLLAVAGLLTGFGAHFGSGCTSGHGVCGIARLSPRSLAATAIFMVAGIITVFIVRHVIGG